MNIHKARMWKSATLLFSLIWGLGYLSTFRCHWTAGPIVATSVILIVASAVVFLKSLVEFES